MFASMSRFLYVMGYATGQISEKEITETQDLALDVLWVQERTCVEMGILSQHAKTEEEWETWCNSQVKMITQFCIQCKTLVDVGEEGEACVQRFIEKKLQTNEMESHFLDAYRIMSGGKMHVCDGRNWCMDPEILESMREACTDLRTKVKEMWDRRFELACEIDAVRNVLALMDRLQPYCIDHADRVGMYCIGGERSTSRPLLLQMQARFDGYDVHVLQDEETDMLVELDKFTKTLRDREAVLERQKRNHQRQQIKKKRGRVDIAWMDI